MNQAEKVKGMLYDWAIICTNERVGDGYILPNDKANDKCGSVLTDDIQVPERWKVSSI